MDFYGDFFGYNPASPEERQEAMDEALRESQFDHIIKDGKVYVNGEEMMRLFAQVGQMLTIRALLLNDERTIGAASGLEVAKNIIGKASSELLRREADAILKAQE